MDVVFMTSDIKCKLNFLVKLPISTSGFFLCKREKYNFVDELFLTGKQVGDEMQVNKERIKVLENFFSTHRDYTPIGFDTYPLEVEKREGILEESYFKQIEELINSRISSYEEYRHVFFTNRGPMMVGRDEFNLCISNYDHPGLQSGVRNCLLKTAYDLGVKLERQFFAEF